MKNKKEFCISAVRGILRSKQIEFKETEANTGSIYFQLKLGNASPCLRLADHPFGRNRPTGTFYWMVGDNAKNKQIKKRLENTIDRIIRYSGIGRTLGALESINGNN